jgi:uncharacterized protein YecE (DUF72 family)
VTPPSPTSTKPPETLSEAERQEIQRKVQEFSTEERDLFLRLAADFNFSNPRQLKRLKNAYAIQKSLEWIQQGKPAGHNEYSPWHKNTLRMLFWQEFLYSIPLQTRHACMVALAFEDYLKRVPKILERPILRVVETVRPEMVKLFVREDHFYQDLARRIRVTVLPHGEEGVLDTREEIEKWLEKVKEEEEKAREAKTLLQSFFQSVTSPEKSEKGVN